MAGASFFCPDEKLADLVGPILHHSSISSDDQEPRQSLAAYFVSLLCRATPGSPSGHWHIAPDYQAMFWTLALTGLRQGDCLASAGVIWTWTRESSSLIVICGEGRPSVLKLLR